MKHVINARRTDPITSHCAGESIERTGQAAFQRQMALAAVRLYPGKTSLELSLLSGIDRFVLARRLPEVKEIEKGDIVKCSVGGRKSVTWKLRQTT